MRLNTLTSIFELSTITLQQDTFYFWFPYGLGDLYITILLKDEIEKVLNGKIIFIIQNKHCFLVDKYNIDYISLSDNYRLKPILLKNITSNIPCKGCIYNAHPLCNNKEFLDYLKVLNGIDWYKKFFNISLDYQIPKEKFLKNVECKLATRQKIFDICHTQVEDVILFIPDALSTNNNCISQMNQLISNKYKNNIILYNSIKNINLLKQAIKIDLTLIELLEICFNCKVVVSNRNGLCDIIQFIGNKLTVFYDKNTYQSWAISKMFNNSLVNEIVI